LAPVSFCIQAKGLPEASSCFGKGIVRERMEIQGIITSVL